MNESGQKFQEVNRLFSAMPYGGGLGFGVIFEDDDASATLNVVAQNLTRLHDKLVYVAEQATQEDERRKAMALRVFALENVVVEQALRIRELEPEGKQ